MLHYYQAHMLIINCISAFIVFCSLLWSKSSVSKAGFLSVLCLLPVVGQAVVVLIVVDTLKRAIYSQGKCTRTHIYKLPEKDNSCSSNEYMTFHCQNCHHKLTDHWSFFV